MSRPLLLLHPSFDMIMDYLCFSGHIKTMSAALGDSSLTFICMLAVEVTLILMVFKQVLHDVTGFHRF